MTVRYVRFRCPDAARHWRYHHITKSQRDKLFSLFGDRVRVTALKPGLFFTKFVVAGIAVHLTPRGKEVDPDECN